MTKKKVTPKETPILEETTTTPPYEIDAAAADMSPIETLAGVVVRPLATFERMRDATRGHWWMVLVLAFLALVLVSIATVPIEAEAARSALQAQQENNDTSQLSESQQAQVEQVQNIFTSQAVLGGISVVTGCIGLVIGYLIRAGFVFLVGLALGGRATFRQVWRMSIWTTLPDVLRTVVSAVVIFITGSQSAPGLSYILTGAEVKAQPYLANFLQSIDIYVIWGLLLLWLGLTATSQLSRTKSAMVALSYWLLTLAFTLGFTALGQSLVGMMGAG
jgi:hypothetical protein